MLVNKIHFHPKMQWMICTILHFVKSVSLDIWHIERYVHLWPLWFSKPTISYTVVTFSSACFRLLVSCLWSVLNVSQISVSNISTLSLLQLIFENSASILWKLYFLNGYKFLIRALLPLLNGALYQKYIVTALKIIIYNNIVCFCLQSSKIFAKLNVS